MKEKVIILFKTDVTAMDAEVGDEQHKTEAFPGLWGNHHDAPALKEADCTDFDEQQWEPETQATAVEPVAGG